MAHPVQRVLTLAIVLQAALQSDALVATSRAKHNASASAGGLRYEPRRGAELGPSTTNAKAGDSSVQCLTNTGGTCMVQNCNTMRGATVCQWGICWCEEGTCAGADGKCYPKTNKVVTAFRLRNVRWPDQYLMVSSWSDTVSVSHDFLSPHSQFTLSELPDGALLLTSVAYPDYAVTTHRRVKCSSETFVQRAQSDKGNSTRDERYCSTAWTAEVDRINNGPASSLGVRITAAPGHEGAIMLSSFDYPDRYYYVSLFTNFLNGLGIDYGDPGDKGYWIPDSPLHVEPETYKGRLCTFDCSDSSRAAPVGLVVVLVLSLAFDSSAVV